MPLLFRPGLSVSRAPGSLAAGHSVRITVSAVDALLAGAAVDVAPGGWAVPVSIQVAG